MKLPKILKLLKVNEMTDDELKEVELSEIEMKRLATIMMSQSLAKVTQSPAVLVFSYDPKGDEGTIGAALHPDFDDFEGLTKALREVADQMDAQQAGLKAAGKTAAAHRDMMEAQDQPKH
jgi:predicted short-subunit dehydrogenase-like oxidoreductase (DUF2520 family)